MRSKFLAVIAAVLALTFIIQSCSKTEYAAKPIVAAVNPIANSTGLKLDNTGDSGIFEVLTASGQTVEVANNSTAVGGTADVSDYTGTSFQKYRITKVDGGYFTLKNMGSGLFGQSYNYNGTQVLIQNTADGHDDQMWSLVPLSTKTYKAINKASGLAITANGTGMVQLKPYTGAASQIWGYNQLPGYDTVKATKLSIANIFQTNMVVQRDKPFPVYGRATPNAVVTVKVSWNSGLFYTVTDATGKWQMNIPESPVNTTPQTLTASVNGLRPVVLSNILIGDVWLCSGQSNMVMPLDSTQPFYGFEGVENYRAEIAAANHPQIRAITLNVDFETKPLDTVKTREPWQVCVPANARLFSAIGYYFARKINADLNVPVGVVISAVSGTSCEAWTSPSAIAANPTLKAYYTKNSVNQLYNGMIYPLRNLSMKGILWYQGEANRDDNPQSNFGLLTTAMATQWRTLFNQGALPFYYVEMTPLARNFFNTNPWGDDPTADDYAFFREVQAGIRATLPNSGLAITMDAGEIIKIHPKYKKPVGERLALLAEKNVYSQAVQCIGPQFSSYTVNGKVATVSFVPGTAEGLNTIKNAPLAQYFFAAGPDHVFRLASAVISGNQMIVTASAATPLPIMAVRYAFTDFPFTNLQNSAGLPMEPFRTDNWTN